MFISKKGTFYSVQQINVILIELKAKYNIKIAYFQPSQSSQNVCIYTL